MPIGIYKRMPKSSVEERFWAKVKKTKGCWYWKATLQRGYGMFTFAPYCRTVAHRYAYELMKGKIPEGLQLDHLCRVRHCVNPKHLEPVTARENQLRGEGIVAKNFKKKSCIRGHPFDEENTRISSNNGQRICLTCCRERMRASRSTKKSMVKQ